MKNICIMLLIVMSVHLRANELQNRNFKESKKILMMTYGQSNKTFYCGCQYRQNKILKNTCKLELKKFQKRSDRLEWEHIVPAHAFGQSFKEWREPNKFCPSRKKKRRKTSRQCARTNEKFLKMESDLYNLVPAVGSVNAVRSNFSMSELTKSEFSICPEVMMSERKFMPPKNRKGDVARIYMYMEKTYPGHGIISNKNAKLFEAWDKQDPVDKEECDLVRKKQQYQKTLNSIVLDRCQEKGL
jgi:deoxyribonuclease I